MVAFRTPTDIGNRSLQHVGAPRMNPVLGLADTSSRGAGEISFCYDMLREAELQRRLWTFATKRQVLRALDSNTMLLTPALWSPFTTYFVGSIVSDEQGSLWISRSPSNLGNDPLLTSYWEPYFGTLSVPLYDASGTTAYYAGELVYTTPGDGTSLVYLSLQEDNGDVPATATPYSSAVTYFKNQVVTFSSVAYMSLIDLNLNNEPDHAPVLFNIATTYSAGTKVGGSDGIIYQSIGSGNVGHDPTTDGGIHWTNTGVLNPWTTVFVGGTGSDKWLLIGGSAFPAGVALATLNIVYPLDSGPASQSFTKNAFRLPAGYLRLAPQSPKTGMNNLGGPSGVDYNDWLIEGDYLISSDVGPIILRFVANITDVTKMHTNFCELLACDIAAAVCQPVTQSSAKLADIRIAKKKAEDAGIIDGIEDEFVDPPDDELISVRY